MPDGEPSVQPSSLRCAKCGYDLTGATIGGRCSECGLTVEASIAARIKPSEAPDLPSHPLAGLVAVVALVSMCVPPLGIPVLVLTVLVRRQVERGSYRLSSKLWVDVALFVSILTSLAGVVMIARYFR